tara:strand:+ start:80 stop:337 length:258 start_codon:yes stop_codon:yes gene_type:complete
MTWKDIIKEDSEMLSLAEDVLNLWKNTDWRTFILDDIHKLPERVNSFSVEKLEELKDKGKYRLNTDKQRNEFERMMDKIIDLKKE